MAANKQKSLGAVGSLRVSSIPATISTCVQLNITTLCTVYYYYYNFSIFVHMVTTLMNSVNYDFLLTSAELEKVNIVIIRSI